MLYYNGIFNLPEDVLRLVLQRLNVQSTIRLSQTSRYANALVTASTHNGPAILSNAKFPLVTTRFEFCNKTGLTLVALLKFHSGNEVCVLDVLSKLVDVKGWASLTGHIAQSTAARVATEQWDAARPTRATERRAQLPRWGHLKTCYGRGGRASGRRRRHVEHAGSGAANRRAFLRSRLGCHGTEVDREERQGLQGTTQHL